MLVTAAIIIPSYSLGRRSVLAAAATKNPSQVRSIDGSFLYNAKSDDGALKFLTDLLLHYIADYCVDVGLGERNLGSPSVYQHRGDATLIRPFIPAVYGDDFVDAARRYA